LTLLEEHVRRFNEGVRSGDFGPMVAAFTEDGELVFEGIPVGPFIGRPAIAAAYDAQPPDDEIELLDDDGTYAWARERASRRGGCG
jgi:steroid Delta-isomerase